MATILYALIDLFQSTIYTFLSCNKKWEAMFMTSHSQKSGGPDPHTFVVLTIGAGPETLTLVALRGKRDFPRELGG